MEPISWHAEHPHHTHFCQHIQANITALHAMIADEATPLNNMTAFLAKHAAINTNDDGTLNNLDPFTFIK